MEKNNQDLTTLKELSALYTVALYICAGVVILSLLIFGIYPITLFNLVFLPHDSWIKIEDIMHPIFILGLVISAAYMAYGKFKDIVNLQSIDTKNYSVVKNSRNYGISYIINSGIVVFIILGSIQFHGFIQPRYQKLQQYYSSGDYDAFFREVDKKFKNEMNKDYIVSQIKYMDELNTDQLKRVLEAKNQIRNNPNLYYKSEGYSWIVLSSLSIENLKSKTYYFFVVLMNVLLVFFLCFAVFAGNRYFVEFKRILG